MANFENYKIFYYVAKNGNITRAAEQLFMTQPAVTKNIHRLEEELKVTLFYRSRKGVELTNEGQTLFSLIAPACEKMMQAEESLMEKLGAGQKRVHFASNYFFSNTYLPHIIRDFHKKYPDVIVNMDCDIGEQIPRFPQSDDRDFLICFGPAYTEEEIARYDLLEVSLCKLKDKIFVGKPLFHLAEKELSITDIMDYSFIVSSEDSWPRMIYEPLFNHHGKEFHQISAGSAQLRLAFLESGAGLVISVSEDCDAEEEGVIKRLKIKEGLPSRELVMYAKKTREDNPSAMLLFDHILEYFRKQDS